MNILVRNTLGTDYLSPDTPDLIISNAQDILDIFSDHLFGEIRTIILKESNLSPAFFDLKTGVAGEILQKFSNYEVKLGITGDFSHYPGKSLKDFIYESNKTGRICFTGSDTEAIELLFKNAKSQYEARLCIIGVDDTDNLDSRGTGHLARSMGEMLEDKELAKVQSIVRHQLLVSPEIPYTSHNSSASLIVLPLREADTIYQACEEFLIQQAAPGSDAGLCMASWNSVSAEVTEWGKRAKSEVLSMEEARHIADAANIRLKGYTGLHTGIIGSLAAVGLRKEGCDGRVLWLRNLRETKGEFMVMDLKNMLGLDYICNRSGEPVPGSAMIGTGDWCRPVMVLKKITLFADCDEHGKWKTADKVFIKSLSE